MIEHTATVRVRYKETDQMGVVYYSNYLVWFEVARAELFRKTGYVYKDIEGKLGLRLVVAEAQCRYLQPAVYDDILKISCKIKNIGITSLTFEYAVKRKKLVLAEGRTVHVFTDSSGKPKRIPSFLKEAFV